MQKELTIREIRKTEYPILEEMLYNAIFQLPQNEPYPFSLIYKPEIYAYIDHFGEQPDDYCLVAELEGEIAGAVWIRILSEKLKGFGNIDPVTPEFAISLKEKYRNQGIGTQLMKSMLKYTKEKGYKQASLSVDKVNYAVRMYKKLGFRIVTENKHDYLMLCNLRELPDEL